MFWRSARFSEGDVQPQGLGGVLDPIVVAPQSWVARRRGSCAGDGEGLHEGLVDGRRRAGGERVAGRIRT